VAVPGLRQDGRRFISDAVARGAGVVVCEGGDPLPGSATGRILVPCARSALALMSDAYFAHPSGRLAVVGITGTNGKTTTSYLVEALLGARGGRTGVIGTIEYRIGDDTETAGQTTPEAPELQSLLARMVAAGVSGVAMEVSSHALALHRVDGIEFDVAVFTNLTQDHLDLHGTMEEYFQAKRKLFGGPQPPPAAVGVADEWGRRLAADLADLGRAPLITFGLDEGEIRPEALEVRPQGSRFRAAGIRIETRLRGLFNVANVLGAVAAGILLDLPEDAIASGVAAVGAVPGRFETIDEGQLFTVVVDYSHKPHALDTVLQAARELVAGRVIVVFGAGGDRDRGKRPLMGKVAVERSDIAIVTSDNPRGEDPLAIIEDVLQGTGVDVEIDPDRRAAIERAIGLAEPGDVVVIAGKGHESGQEIDGVVHPFDDREVARAALAERARAEAPRR
jgi:UDP-N-acetylmuramoyl-L-alanyl-D-glutamate--2,6-diaminopimelate ligase